MERGKGTDFPGHFIRRDTVTLESDYQKNKTNLDQKYIYIWDCDAIYFLSFFD
jgi:hypothetical protein